jgi:hypothetical protein
MRVRAVHSSSSSNGFAGLDGGGAVEALAVEVEVETVVAVEEGLVPSKDMTWPVEEERLRLTAKRGRGSFTLHNEEAK